MKIWIQHDTSSNEIVLKDLQLSDKIWYLKLLIQEIVGVSMYNQKLMKNGEELINRCRLADYNIRDESTVQLSYDLLKPVKLFYILVKCHLFKNDLKLENLTFEDTILDIKIKIQQLVDYPISKQGLLHGGRILKNSCTLFDYHIGNGSTLRWRPEFGKAEPIPFNILVRTSPAKIMRFRIFDDMTVERIKERIIKSEGSSMVRQNLEYNGLKLRDDRIVKNSGLKEGSMLRLVDLPDEGIKIFIKTLHNKMLMIVDLSEKVEIVKIRIDEKCGKNTSITNKQLIYHGRKLNNKHTLKSYNIKQNAVVLLVEILNVYIRTTSNRKIIIKAKSSDSIAKLKARIQFQAGYHQNQQILRLENQQLNDHRMLSNIFRKINKPPILELGFNDHLKVFVQTLTGQILAISDLRSTDTVQDMKKAIQAYDVQTYNRLLVNSSGHPLLEKRSLGYHAIQNDELLYLCSRLSHQLSVEIEGIKLVTIEFNPYDKLDYVKRKIEETESISYDQQVVLHDEIVIPDDTFLAQFVKNPILKIMLKIKIYVGNMFEEQIVINAMPDCTVKSLRRTIRDAGLQICDQQSILFFGNKLKDCSSIKDYNIRDCSTLLIDFAYSTCQKCASCKEVDMKVN